uniref:RRM domain-containing protein n=1 Tax=Quercus lobata TaxID=97700 RepID=A0A7N2L112_QUELO
MSTSGQPQFRYTQTPSKVLHLRNLPWECTEEELIELCKPFGKIVNTKCNVGANRNQAFVEFGDLNQAISMVSYYASSSEPAQVRGKTVYIQYSNRHEIVNNKSPGDVPGNVLLVTIEGVEAGDVSIDVIHLHMLCWYFEKPKGVSRSDCTKVGLFGIIIMYVIHLSKVTHICTGVILHLFLIHLEFPFFCPVVSTPGPVFSAFGFVHKIATFEKAAGFQALIQFSDAETASAARNALNERSIPRYLLPEHVNSCHLRISYSAHTDLNIKFQSHRSRGLVKPGRQNTDVLSWPLICQILSPLSPLDFHHSLSGIMNLSVTKDYTNPYLPVNPTAIEGIVQPAVGPDGKKKELESNVLLASIENMQYAVTVDVLHTVFSAFGTVQKIAIFEKNGQTQALVQYPDVNTAAVAREALEGHCIYDGGYCKLHLSYSRHTDLNVKAYSDKSRDYTIPDISLLAAQQASALPAAQPVWQNPQAGPMYPGNDFTAPGAGPAQYPGGQVSPWDPSMQAGRPPFVSAPSTYPGQSYAASSVSSYASAPMPSSSSPHTPTSQIPSPGASMGLSPGVQANLRPGGVSSPSHLQQGVSPNVRPGGASPPGQPAYYGQ